MIAEALLVCALALVSPGFQMDRNMPGQRDAFLREYKWIIDLLESMYPDSEFLILPKEYSETPPGWTWVPFGWRGHLLYRRPRRAA